MFHFLLLLGTIVLQYSFINCTPDQLCRKEKFPAFLCNSSFSDPRYLKTHADDIVHIGVTLKIVDNNNNREHSSQGFDKGFKVLMIDQETIFLHLIFQNDIENFFSQHLQMCRGRTQHWIIITDSNSVQHLNTIIRNTITKHVTNNIITTYPGTTYLKFPQMKNSLGRRRFRKVPKIILDYIDLDSVATSEDHEQFIASQKSFLVKDLDAGNRKYHDKLFYVAPLYHQIFENLNKLIFMDIGD